MHTNRKHSAHSTLTNKSRLKLLQQREEHLQDLFDSARAQIVDLASQEGRYVQFLEGVIVQGFLTLMEPEGTVKARAKDEAVVKKAVSTAQATYKEVSGREIKTTVEASLSNEL